jgi:hypothetical protein
MNRSQKALLMFVALAVMVIIAGLYGYSVLFGLFFLAMFIMIARQVLLFWIYRKRHAEK